MSLTLIRTLLTTAVMLGSGTISPTLLSQAYATQAIAGQADTVVSFEALDRLDRAVLEKIAKDIPGAIQVQHDVQLYRIIYRSTDRGEAIETSGLVALPVGVTPKATVLYMRGSNLERASSPSMPGRIDGLWEAAVFASNGFALAVPDYIGMGISTRPQAFLLTAPNVLDTRHLLAALRALPQASPASADLFVMGFSQGGQLAAALHRDLETRPEEGYDLKATVAIAGPHELRNYLGRVLQADIDNLLHTGLVAFTAYAFAIYHGRPLDTVFAPPFDRLAPDWFDGSKAAPEILSQVPSRPRDIFGSPGPWPKMKLWHGRSVCRCAWWSG
jgi:pimeloyl-ACP methyl ester carboxylesterase